MAPEFDSEISSTPHLPTRWVAVSHTMTVQLTSMSVLDTRIICFLSRLSFQWRSAVFKNGRSRTRASDFTQTS